MPKDMQLIQFSDLIIQSIWEYRKWEGRTRNVYQKLATGLPFVLTLQ